MSDYSIAVASLIGGIFSVLGLLLYQHGVYKKLSIEHDYNIKRFKLGKRYKLKERELPKAQNKGWLDIAKNLNPNQISQLLDFLPDNPGLTEESEGFEGILSDLIQNNPELVKGFIDGISNKKEPQDAGKFADQSEM
jgi:hypothetical protein